MRWKRGICPAPRSGNLKGPYHLELLDNEDATIGMIKFTSIEHEERDEKNQETNLVLDGTRCPGSKDERCIGKCRNSQICLKILLERGIVYTEPFSDILKGLNDLANRLESGIQRYKDTSSRRGCPNQGKTPDRCGYLLAERPFTAVPLQRPIGTMHQFCSIAIRSMAWKFSLGQVMMDMF